MADTSEFIIPADLVASVIAVARQIRAELEVDTDEALGWSCSLHHRHLKRQDAQFGAMAARFDAGIIPGDRTVPEGDVAWAGNA